MCTELLETCRGFK